MPLSLKFRLYGRCAEAMALYAQAFGAQTVYAEYYDGGRAPAGDTPLEGRVRRAEMTLLGTRAEFVDEADERSRQRSTPALSLRACVDTAENALRAYKLLKAGGNVERALRVTRESACAAELVDRFGISWDLYAEAPPTYSLARADAASAGEVYRVIGESIADTLLDAESPSAVSAWADGWLPGIRDGVETGRLEAYLLMDSDKPVGAAVICARAAQTEARVEAFYTVKRVWGVGAGHYFMDLLIGEIKKRGVKRVTMWAPEDDMRARFFFDDCSYSITGNTRNADGRFAQVEYELDINEYAT